MVRRTPAGTSRRSRADEGFAMSSPLAAVSAAAVLLAGVGFWLTVPERSERDAATLAASASPVEPQVTIEAVKSQPVVRRDEIYVDVYNNSNVTGLASRTADRIGGAGWQVVGSDNWYGTIPATSIYYPPRLERAARLLSRDLGVERVLPAVDPMSLDRLTLILTSDFA